MSAKHTLEPWPVFTDIATALTPDPNCTPVAILSWDDYIRARACVNACEGISTEDLTDIARTGGMLGPREDISRIAKQRDDLANALSELLIEIDGLMGESAGVYGLHLNGDPSPWSKIEEGGRFERLSSMPKARAVLAKAAGEQS